MPLKKSVSTRISSQLFRREANATVVLTVSRVENVHYDSYVTVRLSDSSTIPVLSESVRGVAAFVDTVIRCRVRLNLRRGKGYVRVGIHMADGMGTPLGCTRVNVMPFITSGERRSNGWPIRICVNEKVVIVGLIKCVVDGRHGHSNFEHESVITEQQTQGPDRDSGETRTGLRGLSFLTRSNSLYSSNFESGTQSNSTSMSRTFSKWNKSWPIQVGNIDRDRQRNTADEDSEEHKEDMWPSNKNVPWSAAERMDHDHVALETSTEGQKSKGKGLKIRGRLFRFGQRYFNGADSFSESEIETDTETDTNVTQEQKERERVERENRRLRRVVAQKRAAIKAENVWLRRRAAVLREAVIREPVAGNVAKELEETREKIVRVQAERDYLAQQAQ